VNARTRFGASEWLANSRTGRAFGGLMVDYAGRAVNIAVSLAVTPALIGLLGTSLCGVWITMSQIVLLLNLLDGGIGLYLINTIGATKSGPCVSL
jgi:hypothetical protein